ncbi:hypothetical protein [Jannaschia sp. 2305UL9-9]|uniref:hypothetical protein n=1 Tax=Jannaschia sp. 2305UL9-9 TaxID=3121638 RepID=UPI0035270598
MTTLTKPSRTDLARYFLPLIPAAARQEGIKTLPAFHAWNDRKATRHLGPRAAGLIRKRCRRRPVPFMDDRGEPVFRVPLDDLGNRFALVDAADWFAMQMTVFDGL